MSANGWWRLARSAAANTPVSRQTSGKTHRPAACRDRQCPRLPCRYYREGYEDGYRDGYADASKEDG
ncbi:MAG: hypothetical protein ACRDPY_16305 [Streptosporangiaceae bacterium]